ncbi:hypothetical protein O3M35_000816 [Rhynocoris fuscipes]|uniref:WW domain-containing protein n=1 Tax=Rhynocoris fuscipes TaxID=488301 RepID=A0AAW1DQ47_9HEMI
MGMKRTSKKQGVGIDTPETNRLTWKSKYEQICAAHATNGVSSASNSPREVELEEDTRSSALDGLCGYLSTDDSSAEEEEPDLNDEVEAFLKEVDDIYVGNRDIVPIANETKTTVGGTIMAASNGSIPSVALPTTIDMQAYMQATASGAIPANPQAPTVAWQECYDATTGYTYYWNMMTNEVTWTTPAEYQTYSEALAQWQKYHAEQAARAQLHQQQPQQHLQIQPQPHIPPQQQHQMYSFQTIAKGPQTVVARPHLENKTLQKPLGINMKRKSHNRSDSEDEKIELITSYGPNSGDESSSDQDKKPDIKPIIKKKKKKKVELKSIISNEITDNVSTSKLFGPQLPVSHSSEEVTKKDINSTSLVPYNPDCDDSETEDNTVVNCKLNSVPDKGPPGLEEEISSANSKDSVENEQQEKNEIKVKTENDGITTSNNGGSNSGADEEVDETKLLDRLRSQALLLKQLGGEIPDEVKKMVSSENQSASSASTVNTSTVPSITAIDSKPLVACYGPDSDQEQEASPAKIRVGETGLLSSPASAKRVKVKLSARGRELINTSLATAKARATDFVETSEGLKPIDSVTEESSGTSSSSSCNILGEGTSEGLKKKFPIDGSKSDSGESKRELYSRDDTINIDMPASKKAKFESMIHFVKAETLLLSEKTGAASTTLTEEETGLSDETMKAYIKDTASLLTDKMKFLSAGKESVSPVQIWTIQLETLLSAWEAKHLKISYLKSWLDATSKELERLESSVAPPGWLCTWSRYDTNCHIHLVNHLVSVLFCLFRITLKFTVLHY